MKIANQIAIYQELRNRPVWKLLAADSAPMILTILQYHLLEADGRVPQSILYERVERDLEDLRIAGHDVRQRAQGYIADWLSAGYLERTFPAGAIEEEYEISAPAAQAIRFVETSVERRTTATESRLSAVITQLAKLVEETDSDKTSRIATLASERMRIESEIERVEQGQITVLADMQALERIREVIALTQELVLDFRRVRDEFDVLNRQLREKLLEETESRGTVLESLFEGIDLIGESEAGRTFAAFWKLLIDPQQNQRLENSLEALDQRPFFQKLTMDERQFLRRMTRTLLEQGGIVHDVLQRFARNLKNFVQSREFLEQRRINDLLDKAQRAALSIKDACGLIEKLEFELTSTSCRIRSLSQMTLFDPSLDLSDTSITEAQPGEIDLNTIGQMVAKSEIDIRSLRNNIQSCFTDSSLEQISIGQILLRHPAIQGLGSVIGYMSLGSKHGIIVPGAQEQIEWLSNKNEILEATIPLIYFVRGKLHDSK